MACIGGEYDHDRRADDLKILYKAYATEVLSDGIVDDEKVISYIYIFISSLLMLPLEGHVDIIPF